MNKILRNSGILLIISLCLIFSFFAIRNSLLQNMKDLTSPLERLTTLDLCGKFYDQIPEEICDGPIEVYSFDLFPFIIDYIEIIKDNTSAFDIIESKLKEYRVYCTGLYRIDETDQKYFKCRYDFIGDGEYPFSVTFFRDGRVWKIFTTPGRD